MKRVGFVLKVKSDKIEEYKQHHQQVWPEMLDALRRNGWHNYSLFMKADGTLFGYFEAAEDFEAALAGMAKEEVNAKWQNFMAPYFEALEASQPDKSMQETGRGLPPRLTVLQAQPWRSATASGRPGALARERMLAATRPSGYLMYLIRRSLGSAVSHQLRMLAPKLLRDIARPANRRTLGTIPAAFPQGTRSRRWTSCRA